MTINEQYVYIVHYYMLPATIGEEQLAILEDFLDWVEQEVDWCK